MNAKLAKVVNLQPSQVNCFKKNIVHGNYYDTETRLYSNGLFCVDCLLM